MAVPERIVFLKVYRKPMNLTSTSTRTRVSAAPVVCLHGSYGLAIEIGALRLSVARVSRLKNVRTQGRSTAVVSEFWLV